MEEKKGNGLFWLALLIFGGGAAWAINKYIVAPKKDTTVQNTNTNTNTNNTNSNGKIEPTISSLTNINNFIEGDWNMQISNGVGTSNGVIESADINIANQIISYQGVPRYYIENTDYGFSDDGKSVNMLVTDPNNKGLFFIDFYLTPDFTKMKLIGTDDNNDKLSFSKYKTPPAIPLDITTNYNDATKYGFPFMLTPKMIADSVNKNTITTYPIKNGVNLKSIIYNVVNIPNVLTNYYHGCYALNTMPINPKVQQIWAMYDSNGFFISITDVNPYTLGSNVATGAGSCFIAETPITVTEGIKSIKDININDTIIEKDNAINKVIEINTFLVNEPIYGFNDIKPFVTGSHPFFSKDGWKSVDVNTKHSDILVGQLKINDEILKVNGSYMNLDKISEEYRGTIKVYSLLLDGNNTYYANSLCVHNKKIPPQPKSGSWNGDPFHYTQLSFNVNTI